MTGTQAPTPAERVAAFREYSRLLHVMCSAYRHADGASTPERALWWRKFAMRRWHEAMAISRIHGFDRVAF